MVRCRSRSNGRDKIIHSGRVSYIRISRDRPKGRDEYRRRGRDSEKGILDRIRSRIRLMPSRGRIKGRGRDSCRGRGMVCSRGKGTA